jgi:hypothetical protein
LTVGIQCLNILLLLLLLLLLPLLLLLVLLLLFLLRLLQGSVWGSGAAAMCCAGLAVLTGQHAIWQVC